MNNTLSAPPRATKTATTRPTGQSAAVLPHPALLRRLGLRDLESGPGRESAPIVWLYLASRMSWSKGTRSCWVANRTIARETGLSLRTVEYAIALLIKSGKITVAWKRKGHRYRQNQPVRVMTLEFHGEVIPRVFFPPVEWMLAVWRMARTQRERPASMVALAVACYVWSAAEDGGELVRDRTTKAPLKALEELTGKGHGSAFKARLDALAAAGILTRSGEEWRHGITVPADAQRAELDASVARLPGVHFPDPKMPTCDGPPDWLNEAPWPDDAANDAGSERWTDEDGITWACAGPP